MNKWPGSFAYRTGMEIDKFVAGGLMTVLVAWLTISIQSIRDALTNPEKALRIE